MTKEYDLVVLGGGTGGYVAAIRASQLGMNVAIVEHQKIGGTCLHKGCIPSKALLRTAELNRQMKNIEQFGIEVDAHKVNFTKAQKRKDDVVQTLYAGLNGLLKKANVDVYEGYGRMLGPSIFSPLPGTISIEHMDNEENTMLVPKYVLLATGSKPRELPGLKTDGIHILHSDHALTLKQLPKSMLVIGGGVIGIEWASLLQDLGVNVTVIENSAHILPETDKDVRSELEKELKARGVSFMTSATIQTDSVEIKDEEVTLEVEYEGKQTTLKAEKILVSVGREANIDEIGLANTAIEVKNGVIATNEMYQTKEAHIYAIGDCIGGMQLAHVASAEAIVAVEHMAGEKPRHINPSDIPSCIYAYPEIGSVGLTEQKAKEKGHQIKIGTFPFKANGKAHVFGEPKGFVKIITDEKTEDLLGVHMIGPHATDMISEAGLAKVLDATAWDISHVIYPHPTLSESFFEAALVVEGRQIYY